MAIADKVQQIRQAVFGKDVREAIAGGIEECYTDVSRGKTAADVAAENANEAATNANAKAGLADTAATNANEKADLANTAAANANDKAGLANTAAANANEKAGLANTAAGKINNMTVAASLLPAGSTPTAQISEVSGHKHVAFGIPKGDKGKDFRISRTFVSIAAMNAYTSAELYDYAMIDTGNVEDVDTGKLFCWESDRSWHYIGDLSGAQGIKGETGNGIESIRLNQDYTLTISYTDGTSVTTNPIRGAKGETGNGIASATLNSDFTLTLVFTDGTSYTTTAIRGIQGETGNGISSAVLNSDYTLTLTFTDGTSYTTGRIMPTLSIGTVTDLPAGSDPTASLSGTTANPVLNLGLPHGLSGNETIDDTAGTGDVDLVWSADKLTKEFRDHHEDLTAGTAEQLMSSDAVEDAVPYLYRKSGGGVDVGNRERLEKIVGGTVAWNQLVQNGNFESLSGWSAVNGTLSVSGNIATLTATGKATQFYKVIPTVVNHVYLLSVMVNHSESGKDIVLQGITSSKTVVSVADTWTKINIIGKETNTSHEYNVRSTVSVGSTIRYKNAVMFDLTQMFGQTVADYIMSLGDASPSEAGVAWFRKLFPKDYYEYNAGELISVQAKEHRLTGKNVLSIDDLTSAPSGSISGYTFAHKLTLNLKPNTQYTLSTTFNGDSAVLYFNGAASDDSVKIGGPKTRTTDGNGQISILLYDRTGMDQFMSKSVAVQLEEGNSVTAYEPYSGRTYPLDSSLTLRGIPKLDADNKLYYDGDTYASDGKVARRYGIVDLGTLEWTQYTSDSNSIFYALINDSKTYHRYDVINAVCMLYWQGMPADSRSNIIANLKDKSFSWIYGGVNFVIKDESFADAASFKTAMSGVMLVYELATPTTEQADPYTPIQVIDPYGTEEFVSTSIVPVGHETRYPANLVKKLDGLPWIVPPVITDSASGSIASFTDGADDLPVKELKVGIEPVQDLHGYDHPWPAGGGKNLLNIGGRVSQTSEGVTYTSTNDYLIMNGTKNGTSLVRINNLTCDLPAGTYYAMAFIISGTTSKSVNLVVNDSTSDITGNIIGAEKTFALEEAKTVEFRTGIWSDDTVITNYTLGIVISKDSGIDKWYPYSNICPITGWTGAKVTRTGKNLAGNFLLGEYPDSTTVWKTNISDNRNWISGIIKIPENAPVTVTMVDKGDMTNGSVNVMFYRKDGSYVTNENVGYFTAPTRKTFNYNNVAYIRIFGWQNGNALAINTAKIQVECVSTATSYEPYQGETYDITFPSEAGTVYGGKLTVNRDGSGTLVVDYAIADGGDLNWVATTAGGNPGFRTDSLISVIKSYGYVRADNIICSDYKTATTAENHSVFVYGLLAHGEIYVMDDGYNDATAFKTAMSGVKFVYELATPVTYTLTAPQVKTLLGTNNIWADTGDTEVTYCADTKLYIDRKITEAVANAMNA